ncbi:MAG TPA: DUF2269 family protein [Gemmatimonadales bacterium]|nr:DUF2269 family protein [Gemmatimonadales bacterium]
MSFEEFLAFVHIVASIVWVGGAIGFEFTAHGAMKRGGDEGMKLLARDADRIGRLFGLSSALVLAFGIWAVADRSYYSFSDTWIWLSLVITGLLFLMGPLFFLPNSAKLVAESETKGGSHPEVMARAKRVLNVAHLDSVAALFVVYLMVAKPGA